MSHHIHRLAQLVLLALFASMAYAGNKPGTLANPGFEGQPMKSVFFFAGQWRVPDRPYYKVGEVPTSPASNTCLYTVWPWDGWNHLGWSDNNGGEKREIAVNMMLATGVNVVNMSYWGEPNTDRWAFWAPMQTATGAHDELFATAVGKPLLIAPYIEDGAATVGQQQPNCPEPGVGPIGQSPGYAFADDFPGTSANPAPALVAQIEDLVRRYLKNAAHPEWREKWAQMYDRNGEPRYVISLIHVGSNQVPGLAAAGNDFDEIFAKGFSWVADAVYRDTGVRVGFTLDALPKSSGIARFKPDPLRTGPFLARQAAVLAIQPFNADVWSGLCQVGDHCDLPDCDAPGADCSELDRLVDWKRRYLEAWIATEIPVILDVTPGFDARHVFPGSPRYGNNAKWRKEQRSFTRLGVRGVTGNVWNGYTEGYAIVPACVFSHTEAPPGLPLCPELSFTTNDWFKSLVPPGGSVARRPMKLTGSVPATVPYSDGLTASFTLSGALQSDLCAQLPCPVAGKTIHFRIGTQNVTSTTDANGVARASIKIVQPPGDLVVVASFAGDADYLSIETRHLTKVTKEKTALQWLPPIVGSKTIMLAARLVDDEGNAIGSQTIDFAVGSGSSVSKCRSITAADGVARCKISVSSAPIVVRPVVITFDGDKYFEAAVGTSEINLARK